MADFETTVTSARSLTDTFAYLADFRHVAEWDPGVSKSILVSGDPGRTDAVYELTFSVAGKDTTLLYRALEVEPGLRIVMRAESDAVISEDTMTFAEQSDAVLIHYHAELELKGARKMADPLASLALHRDGKKAAEGLTRELARRG